MKLVLSRDESVQADFKEAVLNPAGNGLYCPQTLPLFKGENYKNLSYEEFALKLIESFEFGHEELFKKALKSYVRFDDKNEPLHFFKVRENLYINELYHGPTRAFKDMALQPFGVILSEFARDKKFLVLCATSGDTGPATLKALENASNIKAAAIYPFHGTSKIQALQMTSLKAHNLKSFAINEDFDAAQRALKTLLNDEEFKNALKSANLELTAANSVNFARILFQIIYHYYACVKLGKKFDIIVPSGNFGDALGAYYAKKMGANIGKIKIASNANHILTDFFTKGEYDLRARKLVKTISPAMDILISSNVERLMYDKFGSVRTKELYESLEKNNFFKLDENELKELQKDFEAGFSTDIETRDFIKEFANTKLIDPHTATCFKLLKDELQTPVLLTSTAEWTKFTPSIYEALFCKKCEDEKEAMIELAELYKIGIKKEILELFEAENEQVRVYEPSKLKHAILEWLK